MPYFPGNRKALSISDHQWREWPFFYWLFGDETLIAMIFRYILKGDGRAFARPWMISGGGSRLKSQRLAPVFVSSRHLCFKGFFRSFLTFFLYYRLLFFRLYESDVKKKLTFRQVL
jgi:hypothetical protein